jgi:hypothetical protein
VVPVAHLATSYRSFELGRSDSFGDHAMFGVNPRRLDAVDWRVQNMITEKGACRQLLDWLVEQIEVLDQHVERMSDVAAGSSQVDDLLDRQQREAREWLCQQLADALEARGIVAA